MAAGRVKNMCGGREMRLRLSSGLFLFQTSSDVVTNTEAIVACLNHIHYSFIAFCMLVVFVWRARAEGGHVFGVDNALSCY